MNIEWTELPRDSLAADSESTLRGEHQVPLFVDSQTYSRSGRPYEDNQRICNIDEEKAKSRNN